jgi:hypothetical protein
LIAINFWIEGEEDHFESRNWPAVPRVGDVFAPSGGERYLVTEVAWCDHVRTGDPAKGERKWEPIRDKPAVAVTVRRAPATT